MKEAKVHLKDKSEENYAESVKQGPDSGHKQAFLESS